MLRTLILTLILSLATAIQMANAQTHSREIKIVQTNHPNTRGLDPNIKGDEEFDYGDGPGWGIFLLLGGEEFPHKSVRQLANEFFNSPHIYDEPWEKYGLEPNYEIWKKAVISIIFYDFEGYDGKMYHTYLTAEDFRFMRDSLPNLIEVRMIGGIEIRGYKGENGTLNGYHEYPDNEIPPYAFDKTYNIKKLNKKRQYRTIILPKETESIAEYAFANIIDLYLDSQEQYDYTFHNRETVGNGESRFWNDAFNGYIYLSNLKNLKTIKDNAFLNTISTRVYLPENLESIGENAFNSDIIKDRPINTNLDSIVINSPMPPKISNNSFGNKFKDAVIFLPNRESSLQYKGDEVWGLSKKITYLGYVSPNPVDIKLDKGNLLINIKEGATETGVVSYFKDGNKVGNIELTKGNNTIPLDPSMEYKITVESEEFDLKPYKIK